MDEHEEREEREDQGELEEEKAERKLFELDDTDDTDDSDDEGPRKRLDADFLLDKVLPTEVDWRDLVRRHPIASVSLAGFLGFLIGRTRGAAIVAGASAAVTSAVMRQLSDVLDSEVFDL